MRPLKLTINAYGKVFKFNIQKYCGYIKCDTTKKVYPISIEAIPLPTKKGISFQCDGCGEYTDETPFHHIVFYKGTEIKYGDW